MWKNNGSKIELCGMSDRRNSKELLMLFILKHCFLSFKHEYKNINE